MNEMKNKLFEMMDKLNPDYNRPQKSGVPLEDISPEDQELFNPMFLSGEFDVLRGAQSPDYDGNYIRVNKFWYWDSPEGQQYKNDLDKRMQDFNSKSQGHDMVLKGLQDWETDDDRTWDASYIFTFSPKQ